MAKADSKAHSTTARRAIPASTASGTPRLEPELVRRASRKGRSRQEGPQPSPLNPLANPAPVIEGVKIDGSTDCRFFSGAPDAIIAAGYAHPSWFGGKEGNKEGNRGRWMGTKRVKVMGLSVTTRVSRDRRSCWMTVSPGKTMPHKLHEAIAEERKQLDSMIKSKEEYKAWALESIRHGALLLQQVIRASRDGYQLHGRYLRKMHRSLDKILRDAQWAPVWYDADLEHGTVLEIKTRTARADDAFQAMLATTMKAVESGRVIAGAKEGLS